MSGPRVQPAVALFGALALVVAAVFAFAWADRSLWLDEAFSVRVATAPVGEALALLREDNGPPLYYLLLSGWIALWGDGERALRALSGGAYLATGAVLFLGGRRLQGSASAGVLAATLFWISPLAVRHAQSARMYALLGLLTAASAVLFLFEIQASNGRRRRWPWAAMVVNTLGLLVQYWFAFVLLAQALTLLLLWGRRGRWTLWLSWAVPFALFVGLWGWVLVDQLDSGSSGWFRPVGPEALLATFLDFYGSWISVCAFAAFTAVVLLGRRLAPRSRAELAEVTGGLASNALLLVCVLSVGVPWLLSLAKPIYLVGRYTLIALPPLVLWLGGALPRAVGPRGALLLVLPLLVVRVLATSGDQQTWARRDQTRSSRASAQRVLNESPANVRLVATGLGGVTLDYYLRRGQRPLTLQTFPAELKAHPGWYNAARMMEQREALSAEARAWVASLPPGHEVWHVQEAADPVAALLDDALQRARGAPVRTLPLPGSFHDRVTVYPP